MSSASQPTDSVPCEYDGCPRTFDSRRSMKVHHFQSHGKKLADRICKGCDEPFSCRRSDQEYCTIQCFNSTKRDRVSTTCSCCYATFEAWPSDLDRGKAQFCSRRCKDITERFNYGADDKLRRYTRPNEFKELVRHVYVYEGHSFESACRIVTHELDGDYSQEEIDDMVSELMSHERNVRNRVWALRPEDLGLSPIGEVAQ